MVRGVMRPAFGFATSHDPAPGQRAVSFGHDRVLAFAILVIVVEHQDPVARAIELVRLGGVGIERRELPAVVLGVQHGQPRFVGRVEAARCDRGQQPGRSSFAILPVYGKQHCNRRGWARQCGRPTVCPPATQHGMQARADRCGTPQANAGYVLEPAVMRSHFQSLERVDMQFFVDSFRETMSKTRHGGEQLHRIGRAPQSFELCPVAGAHHLHERRSDATSHAGQPVESCDALVIGD